MQRPAAPAALLALAAISLAGCLTPRAQVAPSPAVLAARAAAGTKPPACPAGDLASVSPTLASFPFDDARLDEAGSERLAHLAAWLGCHAGVAVVVLPSADNHGDAAHQQDLAARRAQAVAAALRADGAKDAVLRLLAAGAPDPVTEPHLVIRAAGRGW